jgi:hypothetical protein
VTVPLEYLLDRLKANPFVPFRVTLSNRTTYDIHQPSQMWPGRQSVLIGFPSRDDPWVYDKHVTVALIHINNIEPIPGRRRRADQRGQ